MTGFARGLMIGAGVAALAATEHTQRKQAAVERALPAHLMRLALEAAARGGWEFRADVGEKLDRAAAAALADLDHLTISQCARRIDDTATAILKELQAGGPRELLATAAMACLVLLDEGHIRDPRDNGVVVALLVITDLREGWDGFPFREEHLRDKARRLLQIAKGHGLYRRLATLEVAAPVQTSDQLLDA